MKDIGLLLHNINIHEVFPVSFRYEEVIYVYQVSIGKEKINISARHDIENKFNDNHIVSDIEDSLETRIKDKFRRKF